MKIYFAFVFLLLSIFGYSQWIEKGTIPVHAQKIAVDELGNIYYLNDNSINKMNISGKLLASYSNFSLGNISSFDVSDPLRILVFYKDFSSVLFLDNNLSILRDPVSLDDLGIYDAGAVCASHRGGFWVFSQNNKQLLRFNSNLIQEQESAILFNSENLNDNIDLAELTNYLFLSFLSNGIMMFDSFGSFVKQIPVRDAICLHVNATNLYFVENNQLVLYNIKQSKFTYVAPPLSEFVDVAYNQGVWYFAENEQIRIFSQE
jgi:hypothetical protein